MAVLLLLFLTGASLECQTSRNGLHLPNYALVSMFLIC